MLLDVRDLRVVFRRRGEPDVVAVDGVSFVVPAGQVVGLVGESGSGRAAIAMAVRRGRDLAEVPAALRRYRGGDPARRGGVGLLDRPTGRPRLLVADEPTTALDVTRQAQILDRLRHLVRETGAGLLMTTPDLGVAAGMCETVNVLYRGRIVERAQRHRLFGTPRHPYTYGLLGAIPRPDGPVAALATVHGSGADSLPWTHACAFAPRCDRALPVCGDTPPAVEVSGGRLLRCHHPVPASAE